MATHRPTPEDIFRFALAHTAAAIRTGRGSDYPTVRQAATHFGCTQSHVIACVEDGADSGLAEAGNVEYFGLATGVGITGMGAAAISRKGDWLIEAEGEPDDSPHDIAVG